MHDYVHTLGDAVKRARGKLGLTQNEVADKADIDVRTVLNIENYKGNPKMEVLYPLIRVLQIDAREIFNPEMQRKSPALQHLRLLRRSSSYNSNFPICTSCVTRQKCNIYRMK